MSVSTIDVVWGVHQREIESLRRARIFAVGVCENAARLRDAIASNEPNLGARSISAFLGEPGLPPSLQKYLDEVGHLISPVATAVEIPWMSEDFRSEADGVRLPSFAVVRKRESAHDGALGLYATFNQYFTHKLHVSCPHLGVMYGSSEKI